MFLIKKYLLKEVAILSILILFLHLIAIKFYLYWTTDWFDILMHFLGGLLIGLIVLFILKIFISKIFNDDHELILNLLVIGLVLVVGLSWELGEIFVGLTDIFSDKIDTAVDLIMDTIGAIVSIFYLRSKSSE